MPIDGALAQYLSNLFCDGLELANYIQPNQDGLLNFTNRIGLSLISPVGGLSNLGGQAAQFLTDTQRAVGAAVCGIPPNNFSPVLPIGEFSGGQCFATYTATIEYRWQRAPNSPLNPKSGVEVRTVGNLFGPIVSFDTQIPGSALLYTRRLANGTTAQTLIAIFGIEGVVSAQAVVTAGPTRNDGQPDNCGDPPVSIPPEVKDPFSVVGPDLDVDGGDGNGGYTIPSPTINFGPVTLNQDNGLSVDIELPDEGICGTFTLTPQPAFNLKPCTSPPLPGSKQPLPEKGDEDVEPPEELDEQDPEQEDVSAPNKTIIGVFLQSKPDGNYPQTEINGGDGGALLIPRIATLNFKCVIEDEQGAEIERGWTTPVNVQQVRAYVPAPQGVKVVAWSFVPQPGWRCKGKAFEEDYPLCPCKDDRIDIPN